MLYYVTYIQNKTNCPTVQENQATLANRLF
jgi:hypothetical protein